MSQRSLRVCQAKRVAPPIVPNSDSASLSSSQQLHRHSGSSFDSGGSAESSSGGYCSATGSLSSCHVASSSSAWSSSGVGGSAADQRSSIGLDDTFLPPPPPPASPPATGLQHKHHMYSRGTYGRTLASNFVLPLLRIPCFLSSLSAYRLRTSIKFRMSTMRFARRNLLDSISNVVTQKIINSKKGNNNSKMWVSCVISRTRGIFLICISYQIQQLSNKY